MPVTAAGMLSLPLEHLRTALADCPAFRAWTGTASADAAKGRIHLVDLAPPADDGEYGKAELQSHRPFAVIDDFDSPSGDGGDVWVAPRVAVNTFRPAGKLLLWFENNIPADDLANTRDAKLRFSNDVGGILEELIALTGGNTDYLSVHRIERWGPYRRSDQHQAAAQGDHIRVGFCVTWGV